MFYYSTSSTIYNIIYPSIYQLRFQLFLCHHSFYPMSSINHPKNRGQKPVFFRSFFASKSSSNHYMLWSTSIFTLQTTIRHQNYTLNVPCPLDKCTFYSSYFSSFYLVVYVHLFLYLSLF